MRKLIITAVMVLMTFAVGGSALAHEGGHGPCTGGAAAALPFFGMAGPGPEFGRAVSVLATDGARGTVAYIHEVFCDSNSPGE